MSKRKCRNANVETQLPRTHNTLENIGFTRSEALYLDGNSGDVPTPNDGAEGSKTTNDLGDSLIDPEVLEMMSRGPSPAEIEELEFYPKLLQTSRSKSSSYLPKLSGDADTFKPQTNPTQNLQSERLRSGDNNFPLLESLSNEELFENSDALEKARTVSISWAIPGKKQWWGTNAYMTLYRSYPIKQLVPVMNENLQMNMATFETRFRKLGQPLLFRGSNLRKVGFKLHGFEMDELRAMFPIAASKPGAGKYLPNARVDDQEIDLGPGLEAIADDGSIVRKKGMRNFPRNMKVKTEALKKLGAQWPPLVPSRWRQRPSLWMGTSSSGTAFHSDCCDNFIVMVAGIKRITLAPPTDFEALQPRCVGANKGLCYANIADPNAPGVSSSHYHKMIVDVKPGEVLYIPAGWYHHIENRGPTVMYNCWTFGKETMAKF